MNKKLFHQIPFGCKTEQTKMLLTHIEWLVSEKHLEKKLIPLIPYIDEFKKNKKPHNFTIMEVLIMLVYQTISASR